MQIEILYISDCCGSYLSDDHVAYEICPDCHEHCEVIREEYNVTPNQWGCGDGKDCLDSIQPRERKKERKT